MRLVIHAQPFFLRYFVVIANKVQETMNEQPIERFLKAFTSSLCVSQRSIEGYDDISQHGAFGLGRSIFPHGKGKDICGAFSIQKAVIEFRYLLIVGKKQAQFTLMASQAF